MQANGIAAPMLESIPENDKNDEEDVVLLQDIEDLLPPPPPVLIYAVTKEDSVRVDSKRLSLTPQPKVLRQKRVQTRRPPPQAMSSGRVWLFERVPPSIQELKATALECGVDDVQVSAALGIRCLPPHGPDVNVRGLSCAPSTSRRSTATQPTSRPRRSCSVGRSLTLKLGISTT